MGVKLKVFILLSEKLVLKCVLADFSRIEIELSNIMTHAYIVCENWKIIEYELFVYFFNP